MQTKNFLLVLLV